VGEGGGVCRGGMGCEKGSEIGESVCGGGIGKGGAAAERGRVGVA